MEKRDGDEMIPPRRNLGEQLEMKEKNYALRIGRAVGASGAAHWQSVVREK
jgi:hypothetical protein